MEPTHDILWPTDKWPTSFTVTDGRLETPPTDVPTYGMTYPDGWTIRLIQNTAKQAKVIWTCQCGWAHEELREPQDGDLYIMVDEWPDATVRHSETHYDTGESNATDA